MTRTEIEQRLETLDKLEARWQRLGLDADQGADDCELCREAISLGCSDCTWMLCSGSTCLIGLDAPLGDVHRLNSTTPITKAIRKMRTWLKKQEEL